MQGDQLAFPIVPMQSTQLGMQSKKSIQIPQSFPVAGRRKCKPPAGAFIGRVAVGHHRRQSIEPAAQDHQHQALAAMSGSREGQAGEGAGEGARRQSLQEFASRYHGAGLRGRLLNATESRDRPAVALSLVRRWRRARR